MALKLRITSHLCIDDCLVLSIKYLTVKLVKGIMTKIVRNVLCIS